MASSTELLSCVVTSMTISNALPVLMFPGSTGLIILVGSMEPISGLSSMFTYIVCMCVCMQGGVPHEAYAACGVCSLVSGRQVYSLGIRRDQHSTVESNCVGKTRSGTSVTLLS